ncbi:calmodulin [Seiridium cupressi]
MTAEQIEQYKAVFDLFDKDNTGDISAAELGEVMRSLGLHPSEAELRDIIDEGDADHNGSIDFKEFLKMMSQKVEPSDAEKELREAFKVFDRDNSGTISAAELRRAMSVLGDDLTDEQINEMIQSADRDGNGTIDYEEFAYLMTQGKD